MNLMVKMERTLVHQWTSAGRIFAFAGVCLFAAVGFAAESITITARPRYPWNGKVDLRFTIDGTSGTKYDTSFTAKDLVGNTNLTLKTLYKANGTSANVTKEQLLPGTYNWVWDATADCGSGFVCERVQVEGTVEKVLDADTATYMVIDLSGGTSAKSYPKSYLDAVPSGGWTDEYKTSKLVLRKIKSGSNSAGGSMAKDMWVGVFEVTGQQYYLVKGSFSVVLGGGARYIPEKNPTSAVGCMDNRASGFLSTLKSKSGVAARLATSVEWQYACRAGTATDYNNGTSATSANMSKVGWHYGNASSRTTTPGIVGMFVPNAWGLYDMHGNVYEKVSDYYYVAGGGGTYYCGGGYTSAYSVNPNYSQCTSASKTGWDSSNDFVVSGFRVFADVN